jgi:hypothetical protein
MNDILNAIGDVIAWMIPVPLIVFMVVYGTRSAWRADPLGIERMWQKAYLLALALLILAGNFLPVEFETARLVLRIIVFATVTVGLSLQIVNLRRVQTDSPKPLFFTYFTYDAAERRQERKHT